MRPLVRDGDILRVQAVETRALRVSDVVLCTNNAGRVVIHRIVYRMRDRGSASWCRVTRWLTRMDCFRATNSTAGWQPLTAQVRTLT